MGKTKKGPTDEGRVVDWELSAKNTCYALIRYSLKSLKLELIVV